MAKLSNKKKQVKLAPKPSKSKDESISFEQEIVAIANPKENFPVIEKLLFKLTNIAPAENTVDARLRCVFTSANSKSMSSVNYNAMQIMKELIKHNFNIVMNIPIDVLCKYIDELSDEEFKAAFTKRDASDTEDIIKANTIASLESFRAYGRFNREGKKWPDHYDAEYTMCGMADELVEFAAASAEEKSHELGDVLWYFMAVCEFWCASDEEVNTIVDAGVNVDFSAQYDFTKAFHKFVKLMRDEPSNVGNFSVIAPMMADVFRALVVTAGSIDALTNVALENIAKIRSRIARGVVRGSGDNR